MGVRRRASGHRYRLLLDDKARDVDAGRRASWRRCGFYQGSRSRSRRDVCHRCTRFRNRIHRRCGAQVSFPTRRLVLRSRHCDDFRRRTGVNIASEAGFGDDLSVQPVMTGSGASTASSAGSAGSVASYAASVRSILQARAQSISAKSQTTIGVTFTIGPNCSVGSVSIRSSGDSGVDTAVPAIVASSKFPPPPTGALLGQRDDQAAMTPNRGRRSELIRGLFDFLTSLPRRADCRSFATRTINAITSDLARPGRPTVRCRV